MSTETPAKSPPLEDPYVGLTYFTEEYVDFFFGRETETALIIGNLRASRLTLLYAESGVGKSSVLRAGVVARLHDLAERDRRGAGHPRLLPVVYSSWSERPVAGVVQALAEEARRYCREADLPELPEDDLEAALEAVAEALGATVLVILDQFEEHLLYPERGPEGDRVAAQIARCVNRPDLRANFLISIREDSYAELGDLFRGRVKNVYGNFLHLDFLDRAGGREAIEKPIARLNELRPGEEPFGVEPELAEAVLDQVRRDEADERIETTYLQLVMRRLWDEEAGSGSRLLRLETLERLGGAQAIIGSHLDRAMEGGGGGSAGLTPEQRLVAAAVFRFLVTSGGTKIALTAADLAELTELPVAEIEPVLRHLSSPQLHILRPVVSHDEDAEPRFEIFHDALAEPIRDWRARIEAEESEARRRRERAEKEEAQRAAAEAERQAAWERQRKRLAQALLAVAVLALLAGAVVFAIRQSNLAGERAAAGQSVRVAERTSELSSAPSFGPAPAGLAGLEAYGLSPTSEARERALAQLQLNPGLPRVMAGHIGAVESVAFRPGTGQIVSGGDETVRLWSRRGMRAGHSNAKGAVLAVAVSKPVGDGGEWIAAGLKKGGFEVWRLAKGSKKWMEVPHDPPGSGEIRSVAFSPANPRLLAVGGSDERVELWDLGGSGSQPVGMGVGGAVNDLAFAPGGSRLFVATAKGGVRLDVSAAGLGAPFTPIEGRQTAIAAAADGSFAFGSGGGVTLFPAVGPSKRFRLPGRVNSVAFADRGSVLVAGGTDRNVTTWDLATGRAFGSPRTTNRAAVNDIAVSADGRIAAAGGDRLVRVWPLEPRRRLAITVGALSPAETRGRVPTILDIASGGEGRIAAAAGRAGTLIWPLPKWGAVDRVPKPDRIPGDSRAAASHGPLLVTGDGNSFAVYRTDKSCKGLVVCRIAKPSPPYSDAPVGKLTFAHYRNRLLLASTGAMGKKGVVNLWDLGEVKRHGSIKHLSTVSIERHITALAFDRAKPIIAAATKGGTVILWDVAELTRPERVEPKRLKKLNRERLPLYALAFSKDSTVLASGGKGRQVVLWKLNPSARHPEPTRLPGTLLQRQSISQLDFSQDGSVLAAADGAGNVCLYRVDNRHLIGDRSCLRGYSSGPHEKAGFKAIKFGGLHGAPVLFTAGRGQPLVAWNALLWNLSDSGGVDRAVREYTCALAGRNMTETEWESVFPSTDLAGRRDETCPGKGLP